MSAPPAAVAELGDVFLTIEGHDSGCTSYGVADREDGRWFVKVGHGAAADQLRSAVAFHATVAAPHVLPMRRHFPVPGGMAVVYDFVDATILDDPFDPRTSRPGETTALARVTALPTGTVLSLVDRIYAAHRAIAARGYVAVDFYDGSLLYDFGSDTLHLVDLDLYRPGPYVLDADRQFGSSRFMAPEEWVRGSIVDERTTVFTLGRTAQVLLGPAAAERLGDRLCSVVDRACEEQPSDRWPAVAAFTEAWDRHRN